MRALLRSWLLCDSNIPAVIRLSWRYDLSCYLRDGRAIEAYLSTKGSWCGDEVRMRLSANAGNRWRMAILRPPVVTAHTLMENSLGRRARGLFRWIFGNMLYTEQQNTNTSKLNNSQLAAPLVGKTNNEKRCH